MGGDHCVDGGSLLLMKDGNAELPELLNSGVVFRIRSADGMLSVDQDSGQGRHSDTADTDEVNWDLAVERARQGTASEARKISQLSDVVPAEMGRIGQIQQG